MADSPDDELDAAEYVLGTLDAAARGDLERRLAREPALREAVASWQRRLAPLAAAAPVAPSAGLKARVDAAIDGIGAFPTVRAEDGAWRQLAPGVERKVLHADRERGYRSFLLRFAPGGVLPAHEHADDEECVMIEGEIFIAGIRMVAGDWQMAPKGRRHPPITSPRGGIVYIRSAIARDTR